MTCPACVTELGLVFLNYAMEDLRFIPATCQHFERLVQSRFKDSRPFVQVKSDKTLLRRDVA